MVIVWVAKPGVETRSRASLILGDSEVAFSYENPRHPGTQPSDLRQKIFGVHSIAKQSHFEARNSFFRHAAAMFRGAFPKPVVELLRNIPDRQRRHFGPPSIQRGAITEAYG
ncbi:hypothetical protein SBA2_470027 [Acidobacteriia bacterium SbA2]|nr:hypothetical protein SBA2_470027 [Acidobacteriia bacterium SbA2]